MDGASGSHDRRVQQSMGEESQTGSEIWKVEGSEPAKRKRSGIKPGALSKPSVSAEGGDHCTEPRGEESGGKPSRLRSARACQEGLSTTESLILAQDERWRRA